MGFFGRKPGEASSVDKIVGGTKKEQKALGKEMDRRFGQQDGFRDLKRYEREKTPFELEAIRLANEATDALREKYGLAPFEIPAENAHILRRTPETEKKFHAAFVMPHQAFVLVEKRAKAQTLKTVFHEMVHFKSFASIEPDADDLKERRLGLTMRADEDPTAFTPLNEAVTEELTKRFMRANEGHPELRKETGNLQQARKDFPKEETEDLFSVVVSKKPDGQAQMELESFGYSDDRKALALLIDKLKERNKNVFREKEEWFDLFASAMFNGHVLELARVVESTFGKGKFRELGSQKTGEDLLKFVESL